VISIFASEMPILLTVLGRQKTVIGMLFPFVIIKMEVVPFCLSPTASNINSVHY
jgi:hypothetical protein